MVMFELLNCDFCCGSSKF